MLKNFLPLCLVFLLGALGARAQITNGSINYELRADQFRQTCDNDGLSADDNEVRIGLTSDANTGGTTSWPSNGSGASCSGNNYVQRWQADAPSVLATANTLLYRCTGRSGTSNVLNFNYSSWEEDGSPDCSESGDACVSSGSFAYTFRDATRTPCQWWGSAGTLNGNFVTSASGDFLLKTVWRFAQGNDCGNSLNFGTLTSGTTYTHTNSNRAAPSGASADMGYTNVSGNTSPDVFYQFVLAAPSSVTLSLNNSGTNFDTFLRLRTSGCGSEITFNDDFGGSTYSTITIDLCAGTYIAQVEGYSTNTGDFTLSVLANTKAAAGGTIGGIANGLAVCTGTDPGAFTNAAAATGVGTLSYQWESSTTGAGSGYSDIASATSATYDPPALTQTTWYRRRVTDGCAQTAYSNVVQVVVGTVIPNITINGIAPTTSYPFQACSYPYTLTAACSNCGGSQTYNWAGSTGIGGTAATATSSGTAGGSLTVSLNGCQTSFINFTVNTASSSTPPTAISASSTTICSGGSTTLTATGGSLGAGGNYVWYSGSCGGTPAGTGASINVSPTASTTYFVRAEGTCNTTTCASTTINVNAVSTAVTAIGASPNLPEYCPGSSIALTASGGTAGAGSSVAWYTAPNGGGTALGTGNSITVTPNASTTYYARREGGCATSADFSTTINVKTFVYAANGATANSYCTDASGWHHFFNGSQIYLSLRGDLSGATSTPVVTIYDNNAYYQSRTTALNPTICASGITPGEERFEMERAWNLNFAGTLNGSYSVRFYHQPAERTALITAASNWMATYPACGYTYKYNAGASGLFWFKNNGTPYSAPQYDGFQPITSLGTTSNGLAYAEMSGITSFSGGSAGVILVPSTSLPIELVYWRGARIGSVNLLEWQTASEQNTDYFAIERSSNGVDQFVEIGRVAAAGNSTEARSYQFQDPNAPTGVSYYRLRQADADGQTNYTRVIAIEAKASGESHRFMPNPTTDEVRYQFEARAQEEIQIEVFNALGQLLHSQTHQTAVGVQTLPIDLRTYPAGVYQVRVLHKSSGIAVVESIVKRTE